MFMFVYLFICLFQFIPVYTSLYQSMKTEEFFFYSWLLKILPYVWPHLT